MQRQVFAGLGPSLLAVMLLALLAPNGLSSNMVAGAASAPGGTLLAAGDSAQARTTYPAGALAPAATVAWEDGDSHKWIGEGWGDHAPSSLTWGNFHGRDCLQVRWDYAAWLGYARTDLFPDENWESPVIGLQVDAYVESSQSLTDIGLEPRDHNDITIELLWGNATNLAPNQWHTLTWYFTDAEDYGAVAALVFKLDQLGYIPARVYLDDVRLLTATGGSELWDDMDDGSRWWFYSDNWYNWAPRDWGIEPITHNGRNPTTPAGSMYLHWDHDNGVNPALDAAAVGTDRLGDVPDWGVYNRLSADVKISVADAPLSIFFWDDEGVTDPVDCRGFGTSTAKASAADTWQTITWDLPWPSCFDPAGVDQIKFVVNNIDEYETGTLYIDNIFLVSDPLPPPVTGLSYVFEDFDDRSESFNDFSGNWGELSGDYVTTSFDSTAFAGAGGASLKIEYDLPAESYTGLWHSLWGHSDYAQTLDFTDIYGSLSGEAKDFEQLQFWVRGSGATSGTHNVKVELKDSIPGGVHTAYRYITIDDSDATWQQIVLDADVTNDSFWSYSEEGGPDPTSMKQLVFVIESYFNDPEGTFYIDDIQFVDADDAPFEIGPDDDDEFLELVSERTFLYFLDRYDPNTGLFLDRSTFPDLMSIASTGFGLTALTIGESRGWIEQPQAVDMIVRTLNTLNEGQAATDTVHHATSDTNGYKGFYYHFLGTDGLRKFDGEGAGSELSSVDTAILMMGVLNVKEYFPDVPEIQELADQLYERVEWDWMLRQLEGDPSDGQFYLAWKPEYVEGQEDDPDTPENEFLAPYEIPAPGGGYFCGTLENPSTWDYTTDEVILINLLAIGSPTHPVPADVFYAWTREEDEYEGHSLVRSWNGSYFTYAFAHLWIDFESLGDDGHPVLAVDWWQNSVEAARANWQFAVDHQDGDTCNGEEDRYTTYSETSWGLTAADNPCPGDPNPYHAYGALPAAAAPDHDGTIAPYGAGMGMMFLPEKAIPALKHYFEGTDLWRYRFGFGDSYNLDPADCGGACYNHAAFGIDQGPILIAIENYRTGLVWATMAGERHLREAICMIWTCNRVYLPLVLR